MLHDHDIRLALSIVRPRLIERIAFASTQRIALILAPAGYGKSVALRQFLETLDEPFVRYDVRAEHTTLLGFVRGLADALLEVAPDARKTVAGAEERSRSSKTPGTDLAMWMRTHLEEFSGIVALDDLHAAEDDPQVSAFLSALIERTKPHIRWILASRSSLDLPVGSWLAYGEMDLPIDEHDLRFSADEARQAASGASSLSASEVQELVMLTEGWPAALSFALRTSARSADLQMVAASTREMTYRYLAEQVYRALSEAERDLLHFAALLPEISVDLVRRAGYADATAALEALSVRVAFIYSDGAAYRCHDLFRDFLQHELELRGDFAVAAMHRRVAAALEASGDVAQALVHYADGSCAADVLRLLADSGFDLMEHAHADAVQVAIDSLPDETRKSDAVVLGMRGLQEANTGRFDRAESLLRRAIDRSGEDTLKATLAIRLALVLINQQRDATGLLEPLRDLSLPRTMQGEILSLLAVAYTSAGRPDDARELFTQVEEALAQIDEDSVRAKILQRMGSCGSQVGIRFAHIGERLTAAATLAERAGLYSLASRAYCTLSNMAIFHEDDVRQSILFAQRGAETAAKAGDRLGMQTAYLQLMLAEVRRGNSEELQRLEMQFAAASTSDAVRMAHVIPIRASRAAWEGRFAEAYRLLSSCVDRIGTIWEQIYHRAECALYLAGSGNDAKAKIYVDEVRRVMEGEQAPSLVFAQHQRALAAMVSASTEAIAGRTTSAMRLVRRGAGYGAVAKCMSDFVFSLCQAIKTPAFREEMWPHLERLEALGQGGLSRVLRMVAEHRLPREQAALISLTPSELKILAALDEGRAPKEIAEESGRSVYTVQAHVHNIIRKLGCSGRSEALAIARRRGLLTN